MKEIKRSFLHMDLRFIVVITTDDEVYLPVGYSGEYINKQEFESGNDIAEMTKGAKEEIIKLFDTKFIK